MGSNEEYLDNLLKSMESSDTSTGTKEIDEMADEDIDALFAAAERILNDELIGYDSEEVTYAPAEKEPEKEPEEEPPAVTEEEAAAVEEVPAVVVEEAPAAAEEEMPAAIEEEPFAATVEEPEEKEEAYPTVESTIALTQEEIEMLLANTEVPREEAAADTVQEDVPDEMAQDDLMELLNSLGTNDDLNAIGDLLEAADSGEPPVDNEEPSYAEEEIFTPETAFPEEVEAIEEIEDINAIEDLEERGKKGRKKRERKPKKEKAPKEKKVKEKKPKKKRGADEEEAIAADGAIAAEGDNAAGADSAGSAKKGLFSKLFSALTEEDESNVSDENQAIMQELAEEDLKEAGKKKKVKKGKKPADGKKGTDDFDEDEEDTGKGKKKGKPKKEPKPKKQKAPKEPAVPEKPGKRISPKSIVVVVLFAATIFGGIFLSISLFSGELRMQSAKEAFEQRDYMVCYEEMYGMDRNEEEEKMFRHAEIVLKMQRRITIYEKYMEEGRELEALDSLMQAVADYDAMYAKAQECDAGQEIAGLYDRIIQILEDSYGLQQDAARAIASCQSNVDYTRYLTALITGEGVSVDGNPGGVALPQEELRDVLPAEEELEQPGFAD